MDEEYIQKNASIGNILSKAWEKFTQNFKLIFLITIIIYIPINIFYYFLPIDETFDGFLLYLRIIKIIEGLIAILGTIAIIHLTNNSINNKETTLGDAFKKAFSKWPSVIITNIILGFFLFGLFILLIIPGFIFSIFWIFTLYIVVIRGISGKDALNYSKSIVTGRWWEVFGYAFVFAIIQIPIFLIYLILGWLMPENVITSVLLDTTLDVAMSFFIVCSVIFFLSFEKSRKTNIDNIEEYNNIKKNNQNIDNDNKVIEIDNNKSIKNKNQLKNTKSKKTINKK